MRRFFLFLTGCALLHFWCSALPCQETYGERLSAAGRSAQTIPSEQRIDINHASIGELMQIPGLTKTWAGRIVRYRPYRTKQDLLDRGIVPNALYERIRDRVIAHREKH